MEKEVVRGLSDRSSVPQLLNRGLPALILFILNFLPGLLLINEGLFHIDSIILARAVEDTYRTGVLQSPVGGRYGLVIVNMITYLPFFVLGHNADFSVRITSVLFHALSVVMFYLFMAELFADRVLAFSGALLLSFAPFYFIPDTYGKEHGIAMFFLLGSFSLLLGGIKRTSRPILALSSLALAVSVSVRESMLVTVPLFYLFFLGMGLDIKIYPVKVAMIRKRLNTGSLLAVLAPFISVLSLLLLGHLRVILFTILRDPSPKTMQSFVYFLGIYSEMLPYALNDLMISVSKPVLILSAVGMIRMFFFGKKTFISILFFLWFLLLFYFGNLSAFNARYLDIVMVPICVFCGYILSYLYSKQRILAAGLIVYFVYGMFAFMYPLADFRHSWCGPKRFAEFVKTNTEENAIVIAADNSQAIEYYGHRRTVQYPRGEPDKADIFVMDIDRYLKSHIPVYLIETGMSDLESFSTKVLSRFDLHLVGESLNEDFHRPELSLQLYREKLYRLTLNSPSA